MHLLELLLFALKTKRKRGRREEEGEHPDKRGEGGDEKRRSPKGRICSCRSFSVGVIQKAREGRQWKKEGGGIPKNHPAALLSFICHKTIPAVSPKFNL